MGNHYAEGWVSSVSAGGTDTNWRIYTACGNSVTDSWQIYISGALSASNNGGSQGPNQLGINVNTEYSNGQCGFLLAYNRVLSQAEIVQNYNALRGRYGI